MAPNAQNLDKIEDCFGHRVRLACHDHKVTAVWSDSPHDTSLRFLHPDRALAEIRGG